MLSTIWRLITSSANSDGVQWLTGRWLSTGSSQETTMICTICSAVNFGGVPLRGRSLKPVKLLLAMADGVGNNELARNHEMDRGVVRKWRNRWVDLVQKLKNAEASEISDEDLRTLILARTTKRYSVLRRLAIS